MYYKKLSVLLLCLFAVSLNGMNDDQFYAKSREITEHDEKSNNIISPIKKYLIIQTILNTYKREYLDWKWQTFLAKEKYWKPLKKGIESGAIACVDIQAGGQQLGFLSYVGPVNNGQEKAILIHQSPYWMYSLLINSDTPIASEIYAASSIGDGSFAFLGFEPKDKKSLPQGLKVDEEYLPGWSTDDRFALWYYNLANNGTDHWISTIKKHEEETKVIGNSDIY